MKKLLKELFYVPKYGKVREKTMMTQVVMTVTIIAFCVAAMGFTAYAYFSHNVSSSNNFIKSANFETNVKIQIQSNTGEEVQVITSNYKSHIANLKANTTYFVSLFPTERSAAKTGFVIVTAEGCENRYHTEQIGVVGDSYTEAISFYLIPSADTKVTFLAHWGTSSFYGHEDKNNALYIMQGESVNILINNIPGATEPDTTPTTAVTTTPTIIETTAATTAPTEITAATAAPTETTAATAAPTEITDATAAPTEITAATAAPTETTAATAAPTETTAATAAPTETTAATAAPTETTAATTAPTEITAATVAPTETTAATAAPTETAPATPSETVHTVQTGETLADIAKLYKTTADQLATYNGITDINIIQIGQALRIPQAEDMTSATTTPPTAEETIPASTAAPTTPNAAQTGATTITPTESTPPQETIVF